MGVPMNVPQVVEQPSRRRRDSSRASNQEHENIINTSRTVLQNMGQNMQVIDAAQRYIQELERENQFLRQLQD